MKSIKKLLPIFLFLLLSSTFLFSQENEPQPFIVSIAPDSLFANYEYSQVKFFVVSIGSTILGDPTESAIKDLNEMIIDFCKKAKFDGFILNQIVFAKPFDEGKLIAYGTLLRKKVNTK